MTTFEKKKDFKAPKSPQYNGSDCNAFLNKAIFRADSANFYVNRSLVAMTWVDFYFDNCRM